MQINSIQSQSIYSNPSFNAKLKLANRDQLDSFNRMIRKETSRHKDKDFDALFERFSNNNINDIVTMEIIKKDGFDQIKLQKVDSENKFYVKIYGEDKKYLYPITSILRATMEDPAFRLIWKI